MNGIAPHKADAHFAPTLKLLQPEMVAQYIKIKKGFNADEFGRFIAAMGDSPRGNPFTIANLMRENLVGCIWDHSPNLWNPPVRVADAFGRVVTNSHKYTSRHHQGCVRVLLHQDMMVPNDAPEAEGLEIGDHICVANQSSDSDEPEPSDPEDIVVDKALRAFFKGHNQWIIEGTRKHINQFFSKYMGQCDNGLYRMVNSGYAQYLFAKIPPSFRF